jgi:hypothetical protein
LIERLRIWWRGRRWSHPRIGHVSYYASQADVPERLAADTLAVVGLAKRPKWAILACPCGRGHRLAVNLSRSRLPYWRLTVDAGGPSLFPSIDFDDGYRCHFRLQNGAVHWVRWTR